MTVISEALLKAVIRCPHSMNDDRVVLHMDKKAAGHNALNQLHTRLAGALAPFEALRVAMEEIATKGGRELTEDGQIVEYDATACVAIAKAALDALSRPQPQAPAVPA